MNLREESRQGLEELGPVFEPEGNERLQTGGEAIGGRSETLSDDRRHRR